MTETRLRTCTDLDVSWQYSVLEILLSPRDECAHSQSRLAAASTDVNDLLLRFFSQVCFRCLNFVFFWASSFPPPLSPSLRHHAVLLGVADAVIVIFLRRFFPLES